MQKNSKILVIVVFILVILSGGIFWIIKQNNFPVDDQQKESESAYEEGLFPEEKPIEHNLKLTIIGPEEDIIMPRQARMYNALVEGNGKYANLVRCNWKFYLNENNKEALYKEQDTSGVLSGESKEICGFTSTLMDKVGKLRVVLTMTVYNAVDDNLESISAEREYIVQN